MANIMLECLSCGGRTWLDLSPAQLSDITGAGETWIACGTCKRDTNWKTADFGRRSGEDRRRSFEVPAPQPAYNLPGTLRGSWQASPAEEEFREPAAPSLQRERRSFSDRRQMLVRQKDRVPMQVPICIRYDNVDGRFEEITKTVNVSPRGVYFKSNRPYSTGATVFVALNYSHTNPGANIEKLGNVVRIDTPANPSDQKGVAMQFY
jgi:hypothetical protein